MATRAELIKLHQRLQTTIVYVTHDQVEAMTMGTRIAVMKDGVLQQLDTPQQLYNHPANTFVAGFIGSPAMNFFEAGVVGTDGGVELRGEGFSVELPANLASRALSLKGKRVVLGIRPEHLDPMAGQENGAYGELPATVEVVESMGSEQYVYATVGGRSLVARLDADVPVRMGDRITLAFPKNQAQIFDAETQRSVLTG